MNPIPANPAPLAASAFSRAAAAVRRVLSGPVGPITYAIVLGLVSMIETFIYASNAHDRPTAMVVNLCATLPLALWRRRLPLTTSVVTIAALAMVSGVVTPTAAGILGELSILYLVASRYSRFVSFALTLPFLVNVMFPWAGNDEVIPGILLLVLVVAAQVLGDAGGQRRQAIAERDASRRAMEDSLREQVTLEERARIARELHDVVAHHLSAISVQAETARLTTPGMPDEGSARLEAIAGTARDALTEMRRLLGVLRADADEGAEREPQPGLRRLDDLVETARGLGTDVRLTLSGPADSMPTGVDLSAYRIVQEALTNARRHAPGAGVEVELRYEPDVLHIRVRDHGPGPGEGDLPGQGLLGMRERAAMVGGHLRTGSAAGGGFVVEADLPTREPES